MLHVNGLFWSCHLRGVYPPSFTPSLLNGLRTAGPQSGCTHRLSLSLTNMSQLIPLQPFSCSLLLAFQTEAALFPPNICSMYLALLCPSLANLLPPMLIFSQVAAETINLFTVLSQGRCLKRSGKQPQRGLVICCEKDLKHFWKFPASF